MHSAVIDRQFNLQAWNALKGLASTTVEFRLVNRLARAELERLQ
jgi:hypothetical protein